MSVASKNLYDLLGDEGGDSDSAAKTSSQSNARTAARVDAKSAGGRRGASGNEAAFRDRNVGSERNRSKPTEESSGYRGGGGRGARVRGGRGARYPRNQDDRHSKHLPSGSEKQAAQSWGATEGEAELKDEQAGEEIAKTEQKEDAAEGEAAPAEPAEPEPIQVSYADYLAQQEEKKLNLEFELQASVRKPNEGSKLDKKWVNATALVKGEDEDYFAGTGGKAKRERERKTKNILELDNRYIEPERTRGGGRGGRGGRGRGDRGDGPRRGPRAGPRGGTGLNTLDSNAFPALGKATPS